MPEFDCRATPWGGLGGARTTAVQATSSRQAQRGSAAPTCGKPPAFQPVPEPTPSSARAGRPSLPACAEEVLQEPRPSERRSLSASQAAEPQVVIDSVERNLDRPGTNPGPTPQIRTLPEPFRKSGGRAAPPEDVSGENVETEEAAPRGGPTETAVLRDLCGLCG
jgi:hypothetical protein